MVGAPINARSQYDDWRRILCRAAHGRAGFKGWAGAKLYGIKKWLTLGANIGVVLGLILVFIDVRQNAELTRTQMDQRKNDFRKRQPKAVGRVRR